MGRKHLAFTWWVGRTRHVARAVGPLPNPSSRPTHGGPSCPISLFPGQRAAATAASCALRSDVVKREADVIDRDARTRACLGAPGTSPSSDDRKASQWPVAKQHLRPPSRLQSTTALTAKRDGDDRLSCVPGCALIGCAAVGWPHSTNGGCSGFTTTAAGGRAPAPGACCWLTLNVPIPPGSACVVCCCCVSTPDGAGFSNGCRKSCVFR